MTEKKQDYKQLMEMYDAGPKQLDEILEGVTEYQLDKARSEGTWTIRQILHHIADTENFWVAIIWAALGHSGCTYDISWLIPGNHYTIPLEYETRPIDDAVVLFKADRRYIGNMVKQLPNAMERNLVLTQKIETSQERTFSVYEMLSWQIQHLDNHLKQIRETRYVHGI